MELIENLTYNFCILKFKDTKPIPFIKVLENYPYSYLERLSYLDLSNIEFIDFVLERIQIDVFERGSYFHLEQYQATFIEVYPQYCEVYEQFTPNILFKLDTQLLIKLLSDWKEFLKDFYAKGWVCVPRDQVKPEFLTQLDK